MSLEWLNLNNEIVEHLLYCGVEPKITKDGLVIDGFYKSGEIVLVSDKKDFIAKARYGEETKITNFDDLVHLNYNWWQRSKDRFDGWKNPEEPWASEMVRLGLVKKITCAYDLYE